MLCYNDVRKSYDVVAFIQAAILQMKYYVFVWYQENYGPSTYELMGTSKSTQIIVVKICRVFDLAHLIDARTSKSIWLCVYINFHPSIVGLLCIINSDKRLLIYQLPKVQVCIWNAKSQHLPLLVGIRPDQQPYKRKFIYFLLWNSYPTLRDSFLFAQRDLLDSYSCIVFYGFCVAWNIPPGNLFFVFYTLIKLENKNQDIKRM